MVGSPPTFAAQRTLDPTPPAPLAAILNLGSQLAQVGFDQELRFDTVHLPNWTFNVNNWTITLTAGWPGVGGNRHFTFTAVAGTPKADTLDYAPPPTDTRNFRLINAAPFTAFPLVVLP